MEAHSNRAHYILGYVISQCAILVIYTMLLPNVVAHSGAPCIQKTSTLCAVYLLHTEKIVVLNGNNMT